jgi:glycosyltransferase involved in cell wall biosynthesis
MRVSIIIPAHNSQEYIDTALRSVEEQSFKDYELIVILDACSDKTLEIVDSRAELY